MPGDDKPEKPWQIRDVPESVRRQVKMYAAEFGLTVAEALEEIVPHGIKHARFQRLHPRPTMHIAARQGMRATPTDKDKPPEPQDEE